LPFPIKCQHLFLLLLLLLLCLASSSKAVCGITWLLRWCCVALQWARPKQCRVRPVRMWQETAPTRFVVAVRPVRSQAVPTHSTARNAPLVWFAFGRWMERMEGTVGRWDGRMEGTMDRWIDRCTSTTDDGMHNTKARTRATPALSHARYAQSDRSLQFPACRFVSALLREPTCRLSVCFQRIAINVKSWRVFCVAMSN
jgi:hypothetical protein